MICSNCKKEVKVALYEGRCKSCFNHLKQQPLEMPKRKVAGFVTKRGLKMNRHGKYVVRLSEGVYLNAKKCPNRVEFERAKIYDTMLTAKKAAKREGGRVIDLNRFSGE